MLSKKLENIFSYEHLSLYFQDQVEFSLNGEWDKISPSLQLENLALIARFEFSFKKSPLRGEYEYLGLV